MHENKKIRLVAYCQGGYISVVGLPSLTRPAWTQSRRSWQSLRSLLKNNANFIRKSKNRVEMYSWKSTKNSLPVKDDICPKVVGDPCIIEAKVKTWATAKDSGLVTHQIFFCLLFPQPICVLGPVEVTRNSVWDYLQCRKGPKAKGLKARSNNFLTEEGSTIGPRSKWLVLRMPKYKKLR